MKKKDLDEYKRKRDFARTPEPAPAAPPAGEAERVFVVHRHEARRLHYDLRLQMEGVLRSWAVPKGFSYEPSDKRLAIRTEDHPLEYETFEGMIPKGEYGAGTMGIWDHGRWRTAKGTDPVADVAAGELKVVLYGRRLRGEWHLVKTKGGPDHWLLFKARDRYAGVNPWARGLDLSLAEAAELPRSMKRMEPAAGSEPFSDPGWVFEMEFDGQRVLAAKRGDAVEFLGKKGLGHPGLAERLPDLAGDLRALPCENAVLDGVLCLLDAGQRPSRALFDEKLAADATKGVLFYAFDLLWLDDWDLRPLPLVERKAALQALVRGGRVQFVDHVVGDGEALAQAAGAAGLPGLVAKRADSRYEAGRSQHWRRVALAAAPADTSFDESLAKSAAGPGRLELSNLDKVYWPGDGYTKGDLIAWYGQAADLMLPYLCDRPVHLNRYPDGIDGKSFYQKQVPDHFPDWILTEELTSESSGKTIRYVICNDRATLLYVANTGSIELHPWLSRRQTPDAPDFALIDLDPKEAPFTWVVRIAVATGKLLRGIGLRPYVKTSGKTGLHIVVPLVGGYTYDHTRAFCEGVARVLVHELRDIATIERDPKRRGGKVYVDFLQNRRGQTIVPPYCVRPVPGAQVSAPLDWDEVDSDLTPARFTIRSMPARLGRLGDLYRPVLADQQELLAAIEKLQEYLRT